MQNNKLALSLQETDVVAFLYEIYLSFSDVAEQKNMDFRFLPSVPSYKMFIDKGNLDKVVYNLLSNVQIDLHSALGLQILVSHGIQSGLQTGDAVDLAVIHGVVPVSTAAAVDGACTGEEAASHFKAEYRD